MVIYFPLTDDDSNQKSQTQKVVANDFYGNHLIDQWPCKSWISLYGPFSISYYPPAMAP